MDWKHIAVTVAAVTLGTLAALYIKGNYIKPTTW